MEINGSNTTVASTKMQGKNAYTVEQIPPQPAQTANFVMGENGVPLTQEQINKLPPEVKAAIGQVPNLGNGKLPPMPDVVGAAPEAEPTATTDAVSASIFGESKDIAKSAFSSLDWKEKMAAGKAIHDNLGFRKWYELHRVNPLDQSDIAPIIVGIIAGAGLTLVAGWIFSNKGE